MTCAGAQYAKCEDAIGKKAARLAEDRKVKKTIKKVDWRCHSLKRETRWKENQGGEKE